MKKNTPPSIRALAQSIASALFRNGTGTHAERLVLWRNAGVSVDQRAQDLGGWSEAVVADHIEDALRAAALVPLPVLEKIVAQLERIVSLQESALLLQGVAKRGKGGLLVPIRPARVRRHPRRRA